MTGFRKRLPALTALTTFESVARLGSFTRAASELGVTQAAVSRQVHLLEEGFGFPLFQRLHRRVELTEKGRALSATTTEAFNLIAGTLDEITREDRSDDLAIAASVSVSQFWLLPRVSAFSRLHPHINLRIVSQDTQADLAGGDIDLALRYGTGMWADGQAEFLFDDEVFPVCSPQYAAERIGGACEPKDLAALSLIASPTSDPSWTGWAEWLAAFGVAAPRKTMGLRCSFYTEAIQAALNGQGVALGWRRMVEGLLREKRLVRVTDEAVRARAGYFMVLPKQRRRGAPVAEFIDWLRTEATDEL